MKRTHVAYAISHLPELFNGDELEAPKVGTRFHVFFADNPHHVDISTINPSQLTYKAT